MDSGNSGSIQSSSGGDEEYDSRAESISAFLNPPARNIGPMSNPPHPQPPPLHHPNSTMFDHPLSDYSPPLLANSNPFLNLDTTSTVWSKTLVRSDLNCTETNPILASPPSSVQPLFGSQPQPRATTDHQIHVVRNPKKRSRASRRAPTTILTTDTTNFRAMVQEFTGIPAPPFTSSPFPRPRLDLFSTPSSIRSNHPLLDSSQPSYLLRPFAQKFQPPPFLSSTTSVSDQLGLLKQPQGLLNMQSQFLTFQSLLQSATPNPKYPLANSSTDSHLKGGVLDEFGLSHGHVNHAQLTGLPNLVSSDNNPTRWADGVGSNNGDQSHLRSVNGDYDYSERVSNGNLNYSASSSNFLGEKGSENVLTRGEGMVESWIRSSD